MESQKLLTLLVLFEAVGVEPKTDCHICFKEWVCAKIKMRGGKPGWYVRFSATLQESFKKIRDDVDNSGCMITDDKEYLEMKSE